MDLDKEAKTHPAYGHAVFSRVQGQIKLFASPLAYHNEFITLTISRSELRHDLSRDWRHPTKELIEVAFSPAQFAQLLTTLNVGEGAPCTIQHTAEEGRIERIQDDEQVETERIQEGFEADLQGLVAKVKQYQKDVEAILSKKSIGKGDREEIRSALAMVLQSVQCNLPFVLEQFQRAAVKVETTAKAEVEAMITSAVERLGLESLKDLAKVISGPAPAKQLTSEAMTQEQVAMAIRCPVCQSPAGVSCESGGSTFHTARYNRAHQMQISQGDPP